MINRQPLSEIARAALARVQKRSQREGIDLFEELNRVGLIATEARIREIENQILRNLYDRLQGMDAGTLVHMFMQGNSNPATAADMREIILSYIKTYIDESR